jgi:SdpC family antimicrobial peptide
MDWEFILKPMDRAARIASSGVLLVSMFACSNTATTASAFTRNDILRGVVFGQGPVGAKLGDFWDSDLVSRYKVSSASANSETATEVAAKLTADIEQHAPAFADAFAEAMVSGDQPTIKTEFAALPGVLRGAVQRVYHIDDATMQRYEDNARTSSRSIDMLSTKTVHTDVAATNEVAVAWWVTHVVVLYGYLAVAYAVAAAVGLIVPASAPVSVNVQGERNVTGELYVETVAEALGGASIAH